jgi:hypothetical protein
MNPREVLLVPLLPHRIKPDMKRTLYFSGETTNEFLLKLDRN